MIQRTQIPDPSGVKDSQAIAVLRAVKDALDSISGRSPRTTPMKELGIDANIYGVIGAVNEIIYRLQGGEPPRHGSPEGASGLVTVSIPSTATLAFQTGTVSYALAAGTAATAGTASYATVAGAATTATSAGDAATAGTASYATIAGAATTATFAGAAASATTATNAGVAATAGTSAYATIAGAATTATFAGAALSATTATSAGVAGSAATAGTSAYATVAGAATTATSAGSASTSGTASYAVVAGAATTATFSGAAVSATTATNAGAAAVAGTAAYSTSAGLVGTWTPAFSLGMNGPTYTAQEGSYQQVGKWIKARGRVTISTGTPTASAVRITLPATAVYDTPAAVHLVVSSSAPASVHMKSIASLALAYLYYDSTTGAVLYPGNSLGPQGDFGFLIEYETP